jgi:hypothetical protein
LGLLLAAGAAVLIYETRGTVFWADEWTWILSRRGGGIDSLLQPHNQHFVLIPVALYKLLFATVGLRHYWPYRGVLVGLELICVSLIFVYARRRVGGFYALFAAALILFFGPGWQDILWPFQSGWILTVLLGVGALLALDREDRAGEVTACVLLGASLASGSPGLAIAVGLAVDVLLRRGRRSMWIVAIPIGLYALWWLGYQQAAFQRQAIVLVPRFMFNSAAATASAIAGLAQVDPTTDGGDFSWGAPLLVIGLVGMAWRLRVLRRLPPRVLTLGAILLAFWAITGLGRAYLHLGPLSLNATGHESRYMYIGAVFAVLLVVELTRVRASEHPAMGAVVGLLAAAAILSNFGSLQDGGGQLRNQAQLTLSGLETMNVSRDIVSPRFVSNGFIFGLLTAGPWFAAEKDIGSPPLSLAQLVSQPDFARVATDSQLVNIQSPVLQEGTASRAVGDTAPHVDAVASGIDDVVGGCVRYRASAAVPSGAVNALALTVPPNGLLVRTGTTPVTVGLRRFFTQFDPVGSIVPGAQATVKLKPDLAPQPWHAQFVGGSSFTVCSLG